MFKFIKNFGTQGKLESFSNDKVRGPISEFRAKRLSLCSP